MPFKGIVGPGIERKIEIHQQLREGEESQLHRVTIDFPPRSFRNDRLDINKIVGWVPILPDLDRWELQPEVLGQPLLKRQICDQILVA